MNQPMQQQPQFQLPNPDEALTDPAAYQQKMASYFAAQTQAQIASVAQPFATQLAETARTLSKTAPDNADVWNKYGSEVDSLVAALPPHARTQAVYDQACVMVRGRHWKDFAAEQAAALAAANPGVERGITASDDGVIDAGSADVWQKIEASALGKATLDAIGKKGIIRNIQKGVYKSLDAYAEALTKSKSATQSVSNRQVIRG